MMMPAHEASLTWAPLFAAAERLAKARSMDDVVEVVRSAARALVGAQGITIVMGEGDYCHYIAEDAIQPLWAGQKFPKTSCISGWVMIHGEPAIIADIFADPRIPHDLYRDTFVRALVMMPVDTGAAPMAIGAYWAEGHVPGDMAVDLLDRLARLVGAAIRNVSLQTSFEIVNRMGAAVATEQNLEIIVQTILDASVELTGAEFGAFFYNLVDEKGESYMLYSLSGVARDAFAGLPMPRNTAVFASTFAGTGIVRSDNIREDSRYGHNEPFHGIPAGHPPVSSFLAVPVVSHSGEVHGGLFFGHHQAGRFADEHEKIMAGVAGHAAIAIDNARLHHKAQREIAARTVAEGELRQLNATLEQRIEQRTEQIRNTFHELEQSERRFGLLVQGVTDYAMCMLDATGTVTSWNVGAERIKGYSAREIVGRHFSCFYMEADRQAGLPARTIQIAAAAGRFETEGWRVRSDGTQYWASIVVDAIHDDEGRLIGFAKVTRDLTEKRAVEEQLRQAQKMEAVGQLTGGIAHDFNNLLTVINGNIELAERSLESDPAKAQRAIANARQGAERAASLTQRLLAFSRRQPLVPKPLQLDRVVEGLSDLLKRAMGELIQLKTISGPHLWAVEADPNQIESALLNLAVNARDAMPDGGTLTIETANAHLDSGYAASHGDVVAGNYVMIAVSDTGTGMAPPVLARIFEPFFTTKEIGRGTGLGLSQVYGFVKQSGGHVEVLSEPEQGTTVKIYLPRFTGNAAGIAEAKAAGALTDPSAAGETILVVEDDDGVRAYSVEILRDLGYRAIEAEDGRAALRLIEEGGEDIDLLFTDVVMPGMSGRELSDRARALKPDLKILYTSGYTREGFLRDGKLDPDISLLAKPFTLQQLAGRLRELLDRA